jgi:8-oxo-dGTP diphosphatase
MDLSEPKMIAVVAGLIFKDGRLLACERRADGPFPLKWEFPGGKIESGEDPKTALVRELKEELGIEADVDRTVFTHTHSYAGFSTVKLRFFHVPRYRGEMVNCVFEQIRWVALEEVAAMDFLDGDRPVIEWLLSADASALWHSAPDANQGRR